MEINYGKSVFDPIHYARAIMSNHLRSEDRKRELALFGFLRRGWTYGAAARQAGISYSTVMSRKASNPEFKKECEDAYNEGTDEFEEEANRRAFKGTLKPVYQQGMRVGTIREYSDTLAALVLKRRNPAFRERHEITGENGAAFTFVLASDKERKL